MRGVVFTGHRKLKLMSFGDPVPGDDEVALEMKASGFCGTDLRHYRGERGASVRGKSAKILVEHRLAFDTPIIAGHEVRNHCQGRQERGRTSVSQRRSCHGVPLNER